MRFLTFGIILAFLFTATHVLVDHEVEGQRPFALLPHPGPCHVHSDKAHPDGHHDHDHEGEPSHEHDPYHHQADTHSHFTWYTPADGKIAPSFAPSVLAIDMVVCPSVASSFSLYGPFPAPPPRELPLYLQWSVLRI